ncbi:MAG TPA: amidohydrolase family protein [Longimicrobium sp.]|jgi:imidazolonepropionase-like amidohydrolase
MPVRIRPILLVLLGACGTRAAPIPSPAVAFTHATVVDVETGRLLPDQTVVVTGREIRAMGPGLRVGAGTRVVDATGKYLIPGLWDMHTHVYSNGPGTLLVYAANGVTSIRDMGADDFARVRGWRDSIAAGLRVGPRMKIASPVVESPRWIAAVRSMEEREGLPTEWLNHRFGPSTAAEAVAFVDSVAALGADHIKVRNYPAPAVLRALMARAKERGLPVVAHTHGGMSPVEVSGAGMASFEHGFFPALTESRRGRDSVYRQLAFNGTHVVPTLVAWDGRVLSGDSLMVRASDDGDPRLRYVAPRVRQRWRDEAKTRKHETPLDWGAMQRADVRNLREMVEAGVAIMVGSDAGAPLVVPGFGTHDELARLVEQGGFTPLQALQAATLRPARFMGAADSLGVISAGRLADLVLLDANPLEDIRNTQKIRAVVLNGRYLDRAALDRLLN